MNKASKPFRRALVGATAFIAAGAALGGVYGVASYATAAQSQSVVTVAGEPVVVGTRRITETLYRNTIADIFGEGIEMSARFEPEARTHGLLQIGSSELSLTSGGFEQYYSLARSIADQVLSEDRRADVMPCEPSNAEGADDACADTFVRQYGRLLYRRPMTDVEVADQVAAARDGAEELGDFYAGLRLALTNMLISPQYLFRVERAELDPQTGAARLDGYTKAMRLASLFWNSAPDGELLAAAESGALHNEAGLKAQIDRLVESPKYEDGVRALFTDMMQYELFDTVTKDAATYPRYSLAVANSAREQTLRTLYDHLVTRRGDYRDIFTTRHTFINRPLAAIYDVPYLSSEEWTEHTWPEDANHSGVVTQVAFLSLFGHPGRSSPTKRGVAINEIFLCEETPLPPPNVDFSIVQDTANPLLRTVRARLLAHGTDAGCAGCHAIFDPLGLALERYDSIGQRRTMENGQPIDVTAELDGATFEGAIGLGEVLHDNERALRCIVRNVFAYGVGHDPKGMAEYDYIDAETARFAENGYDFVDMMKEVAASPEFYEVIYAPEPESTGEDDTTVAASEPLEIAGGL